MAVRKEKDPSTPLQKARISPPWIQTPSHPIRTAATGPVSGQGSEKGYGSEGDREAGTPAERVERGIGEVGVTSPGERA